MSQKKMHQNTPNIELWPNTNSGPAKKALDGGRPHNKNKTSIDFKGYSRSDHVSSLKHVKVQKEEVVFWCIFVRSFAHSLGNVVKLLPYIDLV